jgi:hypothetical protein
MESFKALCAVDVILGIAVKTVGIFALIIAINAMFMINGQVSMW